MRKFIRTVAGAFVMLTLVTGVAYPMLVTALAAAVFPSTTTGSVIVRDGQPVGSSLLGQAFVAPGHFWSRPSGTGPQPYNGGASTGTNVGPTNPAFADAVAQRVEALRAADPGNAAPIPVDLVTTSGSGLDPHISVAAAQYQVARVARVRHLDPVRVGELVAQYTEGRTLGLLGEPRVNVLELNLALDDLR